MDDRDLKKIFSEHKVDVPNDGFSKHIITQLPERRNMLPQIVMAAFILMGLALTLAIQDIQPLIEQIDYLVTSISHLQIPSLVSVVTYFGILALLGIIGYSVAQADVR